ncbi:ribonucleotide reductase [Cronobacter phage vB_CsaM_GAP32]|uniref:Nucleotide reductase subunit C n=1 Tax=Cronobacter phage vB_CsaM_GAP32 TaxID=1141136 RepID=K4F6A1_9CAUD|nr:ribonucleotide reductase [Cronobacter phage vB_CsaM_GAP32]AFC21786.1 hypothetical protein GAP32_336 [Cronobacter phage vB_CsaM_GAP32]
MDNLYTQELLTKLSEIIIENDMDSDKDGKYNDDGIKFVTVKEGDWIDEGKYSYCDWTFFFPELNVYVHCSQSRSGSYYSDYYYDDPDFSFVEPYTKTIVVTDYRTVKVTA